MHKKKSHFAIWLLGSLLCFSNCFSVVEAEEETAAEEPETAETVEEMIQTEETTKTSEGTEKEEPLETQEEDIIDDTILPEETSVLTGEDEFHEKLDLPEITPDPQDGFSDIDELISENDTQEELSEIKDEEELDFTINSTIVASGDCGNAVTWTLDSDGALKIEGTGAMKNYSPISFDGSDSKSPWYSYHETIKSVEIKSGVTSIGDFSFAECSDLVSVIIPDTVNNIGMNAFYKCISLTAITIPDSVVSIGIRLFDECNNLLYVKLSDQLTEIPMRMFNNCFSLHDILLPASVTSIGDAAFMYCKALQTAEIPSGVTSIGSSAFGYCENLMYVMMPDTVNSIGAGAFQYCTKLHSIKIPAAVTSVEDHTYQHCDSVVDLTIPNNVTSIGAGAFSSCTNLDTVLIPSSVNTIKVGAFDGCPNLKTLGGIGSETNVQIEFSDHLDKFYNISYLDVTETGKMVQFTGLFAYIEEIILPSSIKTVGDYAFYGLEYLNTVDLAKGLTSIGAHAFDACTNLAEITIPDGVSNLGDYAFFGCSNLTKITMYESVTVIGNYCFPYSLEDIYYYGTSASWNSISIGDWWKDSFLYQFEIHYDSKPSLILSDDAWGFTNSGEYFCADNYWDLSYEEQDKYTYEISSGDFDRLLSTVGWGKRSTKSKLKGKKKNIWGGSCFGMSSVVVLAKSGDLNIGYFTSSYNKIGDVRLEMNSYGDADVGTVESMINFYQLRQYINNVSKIRNDYSYDYSKRLKNIVDKMRMDGRCVLLYSTIYRNGSKFGRHAVVAYDYKQVNEHEHTFKVYDCSKGRNRVFDVAITENNGEYTASYDDWEEAWDRVDGTIYQEAQIKLHTVMTADDLKQDSLLVAPSVMFASDKEVMVDDQIDLFTNYPSFTCSNGTLTVVINEGEVVSDTIGVTAYGKINDVGMDAEYYFTLPVLEEGTSYTITPASLGLDEYKTSFSFENMKDGFFADIKSEQNGTVNVDRHGKVITSYETASEQEIHVCSEEMTTPWYYMTVEGTSTGLTVDPGIDAAAITSSDNAHVNVSVENDMNKHEVTNVDLSSGIVQVTEGDENNVEIRSGEEVISSETFGYSVVFNSQCGTPVTTLTNVPFGSNITKPADPQRDGYFFEGWYKEDTYDNLWDFENDTVTTDTVLYAGWSIAHYNVKLNASGKGSVSAGGQVNIGEYFKASAEAEEGSVFIGWYKDDQLISKEAEYRFCVLEDTELTAVFRSIVLDKYQLILGIGESYQIMPVIEPAFEAVLPTDEINGDYTWSSSNDEIAAVDGNGLVTGKKTGNAVITVAAKDGSLTATCNVFVEFVDVRDKTAFYYNYVYEMAGKGIVTGWDDGTFRPYGNCNRAAVVTFLWRLDGKPEPSKIADFKDMTGNTDFDKAISWAAEQGITTGWADGTFRPWNTCNRAAIMTFLWRYAGAPETEIDSSFSDMTGNSDFDKAISWGVANGITTGWADGTFRPWNTCNRLAVVSFLGRYNELRN